MTFIDGFLYVTYSKAVLIGVSYSLVIRNTPPPYSPVGQATNVIITIIIIIITLPDLLQKVYPTHEWFFQYLVIFFMTIVMNI
jgi:hypothetical protein